MIERGEIRWLHPLPRPDAADTAQLLAWLTAALVIGAALWALRDRAARLMAMGEDGRGP